MAKEVDLQAILQFVSNETGLSVKEILDTADAVARHETGGTFDPAQRQKGGGPGSGLFQFETGADRGGGTAARRLKNTLAEMGAPTAFADSLARQSGVDFSMLSADAQTAAFVADKFQSGAWKKLKKANSLADWWADNHWMGSIKDRPARMKSFLSSVP